MSACALRTRRPEPHLRVVSACLHLSCPLLTINLPLPDRSICDAYTHTVAPIGRAGRLRARACVCASNAALHAPPAHRCGKPCLFSCLPDYAPNSSQTRQYSTSILTKSLRSASLGAYMLRHGRALQTRRCARLESDVGSDAGGHGDQM